MANQILVNPFPCGFDSSQSSLTVCGTVALAGSAVATGEPLAWNDLVEGIGYNEINYRGNGQRGNATALTTGFAVSAGICTVTAANNFFVGQPVTFVGNTQTLSALFNGLTVTVLTASSTQFTFATNLTGTTTTGDVGLANAAQFRSLPVPPDGTNLQLSVTALAASAGVITVTANNNLLPGSTVNFQPGFTGTLGPLLANAGAQVVLSASATAFTIASALTGTTGVGKAVGVNPAQPYSISFWSATSSGYTYVYSMATGVLFVMIGAPGNSAPMAALSAGAYPANVLSDVICYEAKFAKG